MNFSLLIPEITGCAVLIFLLVRETLIGTRKEPQAASWFLAIGGAFLLLASIFPLYGRTESGFGGMIVLDPFALFFKTVFALIMIAIVFISREYFSARGGSAFGGKNYNASEFLMILWSSLIGLFFLTSANDFLLMFVALETFTLALYILAAYQKREMPSVEAGLKYLIIGSLASAFMIYGIGLIFVGTGSTSFLALNDALKAAPDSKLLLMGLLFVIAGLGFKVASVPFQLWAPDVYEGAPTPVTAYLSTASKSAGFVLLLRVLFTAAPSFDTSRTLLFGTLAVLTLSYGNLGALLQTNVKRLFGYSSITHAGYLLIGLAVGTELGAASVLFYLGGYIISNLAAFCVITVVEKASGSSHMDAFRGLGKRSPFLAGTFFLSLLSLAGVPPLAGFFGKFLILLTAVRGNIVWLAVLGALFVAVSLYYYLNLVRVMYFEEPSNESAVETPKSLKTLLLILSAGIIVLGLYQEPLMKAALFAASSLF